MVLQPFTAKDKRFHCAVHLANLKHQMSHRLIRTSNSQHMGPCSNVPQPGSSDLIRLGSQIFRRRYHRPLIVFITPLRRVNGKAPVTILYHDRRRHRHVSSGPHTSASSTLTISLSHSFHQQTSSSKHSISQGNLLLTSNFPLSESFSIFFRSRNSRVTPLQNLLHMRSPPQGPPLRRTLPGIK